MTKKTKHVALAAAVILVTALLAGISLALHPATSRSPSLARLQPSLTPKSSPSLSPTSTVAVDPVVSARPTPTKGPVRPSAPSATPIIPTPYFATLPVGAQLPSDAQCAGRLAKSAWEPRPQNATANHTNAYQQGFRLTNSYLAAYGAGYEGRVTGNFTGTTDQIIRWAACKWGFDENTVRAQAVIESNWMQSQLGDCNGGTTQPATHGCESVGLLQVRGADIPATHPGTWPAAWTSTAFNVDYTLAVRRACFDGKETWLREFNSSYGAGDLWGCIGRWFSGRWHDAAANQYIQKVQSVNATRPWITWR